MKKNKFAQLNQKISDFPLWIKEVLYVNIKKNMISLVGIDGIVQSEEDLFQYACPKLTYKGRTELVNRTKKHSQALYLFLSFLDKDYSIIEIMLEKTWTMEEVAKLYMMAFELEYVPALPSKLSQAAALYFASKIRVGEYLKLIGKLDLEQLEYAVNLQRTYLIDDIKKQMGEILIECGYVQEKDLQNILTLKDESKKRFDLNLDFSSSADINANLEKQIETLKKENYLLKRKLKAFIEKDIQK